MKALLAVAFALLAVPAWAQPVLDLSVTDVDPRYTWFDQPNVTDAGDARIRIVFDGHEGAAALTPNQYWAYAQSYKRHLARLAMHRSVAHAQAHARYHAFREVAASYPQLRVEGFVLRVSYADALITPDL